MFIACWPTFVLNNISKPFSADHGASMWATDVPGWITAAGTAILAIFAVFTAWYARMAFRKQSQEVRDQAGMLQVQSEQLSEQRKINAEQVRVLGLQAEELQASLAERKREAVERRSAQAAQVSLIVKTFRTSRRVPIRDSGSM